MSDALIALILGAVLGFGGAWKIQDWRASAKEKARVEQNLRTVQDNAAVTLRRAENVINAQNASNSRLAGLAADNRAARGELDRLRSTLSGSLGFPSSAIAACPERTITASELLSDCAGELQALAGKADRHAEDARKLLDAWPK
jgi:hypothetical protein